MKPSFIEGGIAVDDRGELIFANAFPLADYKRFYFVKNHEANFVRAWHGHRHESKAILVVEGAAVVGAVQIDDWNNPSKDLEVSRVVLSSKKPMLYRIPAGYANGLMTLAPNTVICVFSDSTLEESANDDIRFPARFWDIWTVEER